MKIIDHNQTIWCKHFNGTENPACKAGVKYLDVSLAHEPIEYVYDNRPRYPHTLRRSLPCIQELNLGGATCEKCAYPTAAEIEAEAKEDARRWENLSTARAAIVQHLGGPWKKGMTGTYGVIDCPVCQGIKTLRFSRAGYNGHIHAKCVTSRCVAWME